MILTLCRGLSRLPLKWLHRAGIVLGWLVYWASPRYAALLRENLQASGLAPDETRRRRLLHAAVGESGKGVAELPAVWFRPPEVLDCLVRCETWNVVDDVRRAGRGVIFLTPHLGCFEIAALYSARRLPLTVLYRSPKLRWLEPLMRAGRERAQARPVPATLRGVRALYKALLAGEAVGLLPDQVPGVGEGAWAPFFGRPAYTMTLVGRLQDATRAAVVLAVAERLPAGSGYHLHFEQLVAQPLDETALNRAIERMIEKCPAQYLWSYNRYKTPADARAAG